MRRPEVAGGSGFALGKILPDAAKPDFSDITLEGTEGQITQFNIRSKLGENFLIIGIPNEIFGISSPKSETIVFMVPRIIRTLKNRYRRQINNYRN